MKKTKEKISALEVFNVLAIFIPIIGLTIFNSIYFIVGIFGFQVVVFLLNLKYNKRRLNSIDKKLLIILIISFIATLIVDLLGNYYEYTVKTTLLIWGSIFLIALIIITNKNKVNTMRILSKLIVITTIILVIYAVLLKTFGNTPVLFEKNGDILIYKQYVNIFGIRFYQNICGDVDIGYAVASLTVNPNMLTGLIFISIIIIISTQIKNKKIEKLENIKNVLKIVVLIYGLYIAHSRMSIILLFSVIPIYLIIKPKNKETKDKKNIFIIFLLILICSILLVIIFPNVFNSFDLNGRNVMWDVATNKIKENIFQVNGLGASGRIITETSGISLSMHNAYLAFLLDYGILFFLIFIILNLKIIYKSMLFITGKYKQEIEEYIMIFLIYLCLLINALSEGTFMTYSMYNYLYFYCVFNMYYLLNMEG